MEYFKEIRILAFSLLSTTIIFLILVVPGVSDIVQLTLFALWYLLLLSFKFAVWVHQCILTSTIVLLPVLVVLGAQNYAESVAQWVFYLVFAEIARSVLVVGCDNKSVR